MPDTRTQTTDKTVILFGETPAGTPPAVQTWFYPGESIGYELVYPKDQAVKIARATHRRVLASDSNTTDTKDVRGAKIGHVDENGTFSSDDTRATSGSTTSGNKPSDRDKDKDRK